MAIQNATVYGTLINEDRFSKEKKSLDGKLRNKSLFYTYTTLEISKEVLKKFQQDQKILNSKGIPSLVTRKFFNLCAIAVSTLYLIGRIFWTVITEPCSRHSWYSCAKDGKIAVGQAIRFFNNAYGEYWIDLARFNQECYQSHYKDRVERPQSSELKRKEREKFILVKEVLKSVKSLLEKPTKENLEGAIQKLNTVPMAVIFETDEIDQKEKKELNDIVLKINTLRPEAKSIHLLFAPTSFDKKRESFESVISKNSLSSAFIKENAAEIAAWYLADLKLPENTEQTQEEYAIKQLKKIQDILIKNGPEVHKELLIRIENRIVCLDEKDEKAQKRIQNEPDDLIKKHFCDLFISVGEVN